MSRRLMIFLLMLAAVLFAIGMVMLANAPAPDAVAKGGDTASLAVAYVSLATSVVSLLAALAGLVKSVLDVKKAAQKPTP